MPISLTLDTNCIVDVAENREQKQYVQALIAAHQEGRAEVALVATTGSEKNSGGKFSLDFREFEERRIALGFGELELLLPIGRSDISFYDQALWADDQMVELEEEIFSVLFPTAQVIWSADASSNNVSTDDIASKQYEKWRNKILDVQMLWAHIWNKRDVFVTSDKNFKRKLKHSRFGSVVVANPSEALNFVRGV